MSIDQIMDAVIKLHKESSEEYLREWFFEGHVSIVARYAEEVAKKVGADIDVCIIAALCHDVARTWNIEKDPELMEESLKFTEKIMNESGLGDKFNMVKEAILHHSCRDTLPSTKEGKVLATADGLAHLMTDFYFIFSWNDHWLKKADSFPDYKKWVASKIERDFQKKIFFDEYKEKARKRYEAFKALFAD